VAFQAVLEALQKEGLIPKRAKQRLDSTHVLSAVRDMSALECVRETLRLGLEALEKELDAGERPEFWAELWERYVENKFDFRSAPEVLTSKHRQSGIDAKRLLECCGAPNCFVGLASKYFVGKEVFGHAVSWAADR
jgi:transposase